MKRSICVMLALLLVLSLSGPVLAAEGDDGVKITWLSVPGIPCRYIEELGWLELRKEGSNSDYTYVDLATGAVQEYDDVNYFSDGLMQVGKYDADGNKKYGYINTSGEVVIPLEYNGANSFSEGLARVEKAGKYGYVNTRGEEVIPLQYDVAAYSFSEGLAYVGKRYAEGFWGIKYGYINTSGEVVVPLEYDDADSFSEGLAHVGMVDADGFWGRKYGYINTSGEVVVPLQYDEADSFFEGLAGVCKYTGDFMYGYINTDGEVVIPLEYGGAGSFSDGLTYVYKYVNGSAKYGYINANGEVIVPLEYDSVSYWFSEGMAEVAMRDADWNWKYGYVNTHGEVVVPLEYDSAGTFSEGLASVGKCDVDGNEKNGYINTSGEMIVPMEYDEARNFSYGLAQVKKAGMYGFINTSGEVVIPLEYDDAGQLGANYCWVKKGASYGICKNPNAGPSYSFPTADAADAGYSGAVEAAGGEAETVYKLTEGLYYVVAKEAKGYTGYLVKAVIRDGREVWTTAASGAPLSQEELDGYVARGLSEPNLQVDFERAAQVTSGRELADSVREMLANIDGLTPNDPAKAALTQYIETGLSTVCSDVIKGRDNVLTLGADSAGALIEEAAAASRELNDILLEAGVTLNKEIVPVSRLLWSGVDPDRPLQVVLGRDLAGTPRGRVELLLGDGSHLIALDGASLETLIRDYDGITIQLSKDGSVYTVAFVGSDGAVIDRLSAPVTVGLPAASSTGTVMASYAGGSTNWGGQYDESSGILSFDAYYSGSYEVVDNAVEIDDIADLDQETQEAVRFLVSKGFLSADGGVFDPDAVVERYHFTKSLVGMFFALNNGAVSTFTDVPQDSPYYVYVASGQAANLVYGISATEFGGEEPLTVEQMLTLTGRTLQEQRGYALPEDPETYLGAFSDGSAVAQWARPHTALSVREGLVTAGGELHPQLPVTRAQAAVILYRLFLKLHTVRPVALPLPETPEEPEPTATDAPAPEPEEEGGADWTVAILSAVAALSAAGAGVAVFVLVKSRKRKTK